MRTSGLIYAAIALMWAAVLIPMWLRNHDSASESRSAERFGQAMRVLRRDQSRTEHGQSRVPEARPDERTTQARPEQPRPAESRTAASPSVESRRAPARRRRPSLAQRRARTLGVLAGLVGVLTLLAILTPLPWWAPVPVAALLVAFVVHLRIQARQQLNRRRVARPVARSQRSSAAPAEVQGEAAPEFGSSGFVSGPSRAVVVETKGSRTEGAGAVSAESAASEPVPSEQGAVDEPDDGEWRPNPLPLPTYVTAPKAVRPIKVIDLTTPGAWSSGRLIEDDLAEEDLLAAEVADAELDALLEQEAVGPETPDADSGRRAVGD